MAHPAHPTKPLLRCFRRVAESSNSSLGRLEWAVREKNKEAHSMGDVSQGKKKSTLQSPNQDQSRPSRE